MPRHISDAELHGVSTVADRDREFGKRPMPAGRGRNCKATVCRKACSDASASTSRDRIRMSSKRRWKSAPALEPEEKSKPCLALAQLLRRHRRRGRRLHPRLIQKNQESGDLMTKAKPGE